MDMLNFVSFFILKLRAPEVAAQWIKELATQPNDLSSIPRNHIVERESEIVL